MSNRIVTRRNFLKTSALAASMAATGLPTTASARRTAKAKLHLASNQYPWLTFYGRDKRDFNANLDASIAEFASADLDGFEPLLAGPAQVDQLIPLLDKHKLQMRSFYMNVLLHVPDQIEKSIDQTLVAAEKAKAVGTRFVVVNPTPIRWGGAENKNDAQLRTQAKALDKLGSKLKAMNLTLSYHFHDIELRNAAREFHHMLVGTDPENVTLCFDAHWVYRGAGDSAVAVFDILELYGKRITELHLRQSRDHVWTEAFGPGDIDYPALAKHLLEINVKPHIVLEQAVEAKSPKTMTAAQAHRKGAQYARKVFAKFA